MLSGGTEQSNVSWKWIKVKKKKLKNINLFATSVPLIDKPGSWFLLAKRLKYTSGRVTF